MPSAHTFDIDIKGEVRDFFRNFSEYVKPFFRMIKKISDQKKIAKNVFSAHNKPFNYGENRVFISKKKDCVQ